MNGFQLKINVKDSSKPMWRRVIVPEKLTFNSLHLVIQKIFAFENCHLYDFKIRKKRIWIPGNDFEYEQIFNNYETNPEVNELGYNWFYNECLYITPNYDINGNKLGYSNMNSTFAIGSYMRKENPIFEDVFKEDLKNIASKTTENLRSFEMFLDGPKTVNVYQNMNFGFMMSFQLEREIVEGTVTVSYVDVDGNKLAETEMFKGEVGTEYFTDEKIFDGYILNNVIGEKNGQYIDGNIDVIYVYAIWGEGDAEDEEITTPEEEITPPNTGVEISITDNQNQQKLEVSSTYIIYYDEKKKKFNR